METLFVCIRFVVSCRFKVSGGNTGGSLAGSRSMPDLSDSRKSRNFTTRSVLHPCPTTIARQTQLRGTDLPCYMQGRAMQIYSFQSATYMAVHVSRVAVASCSHKSVTQTASTWSGLFCGLFGVGGHHCEALDEQFFNFQRADLRQLAATAVAIVSLVSGKKL